MANNLVIPTLAIQNSYNTTGNGNRSYYAQWKIEFPVSYGSSIKTFKVIGGYTESSEGAKTVYLRMINSTSTNEFTTNCLGVYATGMGRTTRTDNGWEYVNITSLSSFTLTQISTGSLWFAFGY